MRVDVGTSDMLSIKRAKLNVAEKHLQIILTITLTLCQH